MVQRIYLEDRKKGIIDNLSKKITIIFHQLSFSSICEMALSVQIHYVQPSSNMPCSWPGGRPRERSLWQFGLHSHCTQTSAFVNFSLGPAVRGGQTITSNPSSHSVLGHFLCLLPAYPFYFQLRGPPAAGGSDSFQWSPCEFYVRAGFWLTDDVFNNSSTTMVDVGALIKLKEEIRWPRSPDHQQSSTNY